MFFGYRVSANVPNTPRTQRGLGAFIGWEVDKNPPPAPNVRVFRIRMTVGDFSFGFQFV